LYYFFTGSVLITFLYPIYVTIKLKIGASRVYNKKTGTPVLTMPWYKSQVLGFMHRYFITKKSLRETHIEQADEIPLIYGRWSGKFGLVVTDPKALQSILTHKHFDKQSLVKEDSANFINKLLSHSLLLATGDGALDLRHMLNPAFRYSMLQGLIPSFNETIQVLINCWKEPSNLYKEIDVEPWFNNLAFDIIGKTGFGVDLKSLTSPTKANADLNYTLKSLFSPLRLVLGTWTEKLPIYKKRNQACDATNRLINSVIEKRMQSKLDNNKNEDLLDLILKADESNTLTTTQVTSELTNKY